MDGTSCSPTLLTSMVKANSGPVPVVLIVEDEPFVRIIVAEFLLENGLKVLEAENAEKALSVLNHRSDVELLFTDINMPGKLDGLALAKEVHERWPDILLMLTSGRERLGGLEIPDSGEFIAKPYSLDEVADKIHELLNR
jgi:two-component system, response regulator PdtaR